MQRALPLAILWVFCTAHNLEATDPVQEEDVTFTWVGDDLYATIDWTGVNEDWQVNFYDASFTFLNTESAYAPVPNPVEVIYGAADPSVAHAKVYWYSGVWQNIWVPVPPKPGGGILSLDGCTADWDLSENDVNVSVDFSGTGSAADELELRLRNSSFQIVDSFTVPMENLSGPQQYTFTDVDCEDAYDVVLRWLIDDVYNDDLTALVAGSCPNPPPACGAQHLGTLETDGGGPTFATLCAEYDENACTVTFSWTGYQEAGFEFHFGIAMTCGVSSIVVPAAASGQAVVDVSHAEPPDPGTGTLIQVGHEVNTQLYNDYYNWAGPDFDGCCGTAPAANATACVDGPGQPLKVQVCADEAGLEIDSWEVLADIEETNILPGQCSPQVELQATGTTGDQITVVVSYIDGSTDNLDITVEDCATCPTCDTCECMRNYQEERDQNNRQGFDDLLQEDSDGDGCPDVLDIFPQDPNFGCDHTYTEVDPEPPLQIESEIPLFWNEVRAIIPPPFVACPEDFAARDHVVNLDFRHGIAEWFEFDYDFSFHSDPAHTYQMGQQDSTVLTSAVVLFRDLFYNLATFYITWFFGRKTFDVMRHY